jgi:WD40 repeat protein
MRFCIAAIGFAFCLLLSTARADSPSTQPAELPNDDEALRQLWKDAFDQSLKVPHDSPEGQALFAEMDRIARKRKALLGEHEERRGNKADFPGEPKPVAELSGPSGTAAIFSPDGSQVLLAGATEATLFDSKDFAAKPRAIFHHFPIYAARFTRDGKRILTAGGPEARFWNAATGERLLTIQQPGEICSAALSSDGKLLATGAKDGTIRLWNAENGAAVEMPAMKHPFAVNFLAFAGEKGDILISGDLWKQSEDPVHTDKDGVRHGPGDKREVRGWNAATGEILWSHGARDPIDSWSDAAVSPDGKRVVILSEVSHEVRIVEASTGKRIRMFRVWNITSAELPTFSPDGAVMAIANWGGVELWDPAAGKLIRKIEAETRDRPKRIAFSPDGKRLLVCAHSAAYGLLSTLSGVYDVASGAKYLDFGRNDVSSGAFDGTGRKVVAGFEDRGGVNAAVWNVPNVAPPPVQPKFVLTKLPEKDQPGWTGLCEEMRTSSLPKDVPLPEKTPFDNDPAQRKGYLEGFRDGFIVGLMHGEDPRENGAAFPSWDRGVSDGMLHAEKVRTRREKMESYLRWQYTKTPPVSDKSPLEDREVQESFIQFSKRFEKALRDALPPDLAMDVTGGTFVYSFDVDDFSKDNTGIPGKAHFYKANLDSDPPGNLQWMRVHPKGKDGGGPDVGDLTGEYRFKFDYDPATQRWSLTPADRYERHAGEPSFSHLQRSDGSGHRWLGADSAEARKWVITALEKAQPAAATKPAAK